MAKYPVPSAQKRAQNGQMRLDKKAKYVRILHLLLESHRRAEIDLADVTRHDVVESHRRSRRTTVPGPGLSGDRTWILKSAFRTAPRLVVALLPSSQQRSLLMRKVIAWGRHEVVMEVCRLCGIGAGTTHYPDGIAFMHTQRKLNHDGLCDDCAKLLARRGKMAAGPASPQGTLLPLS